MAFMSKFTRFFIGAVAIALLSFSGSQSYARDLEPSTSDEQLQRRLLAEILGDNKKGKDAEVRADSLSGSGVATRKNLSMSNKAKVSSKIQNSGYLEGVGTSVASVPTWPVMILVVFMAGILLWLKKGGKLGHSQVNAINKLAVVPLGGKRSLALVEVLGQKLVLGMSEKGLSLLARVDGADADLHKEHKELDADLSEDPFEQEIRDLLGSEPMGDEDGLPASVERVDLARKFRHLRNG